MRTLFLLFFVLVPTLLYAKAELPQNLSAKERVRTLEILGYGSAPKLVSNPYPLGGYSGVDIGFSADFIPLKDLSRLGNGTDDDGQMVFHTLSVGKGLFYNVDGYIYFTPFNQYEDLQSFGAQIKWAFYEMRAAPIAFSMTVYGGGANFSNILDVSTLGGDLMATLMTDWLAFYVGIGSVRAIGRFVGGVDGLTDSATDTTDDVLRGHSFIGLQLQYSKFYIAGQVDIYTDTFYGAKLGVRF